MENNEHLELSKLVELIELEGMMEADIIKSKLFKKTATAKLLAAAEY